MNSGNANALSLNATKYVVVDVESMGFDTATTKDDPNIPVGMLGCQFYPLLEVTALCCDSDFQPTADPITVTIKIEEEDLAKSTAWATKNHGAELYPACLKDGVPMAEAASTLIEKLKLLGVKAKEAHFVGNSFSLDRSFLAVNMPELIDFFHYRIVDVSSLKVVLQQLHGDKAVYPKKLTHRSEDDVKETLEELHFFMNNFIVKPT